MMIERLETTKRIITIDMDNEKKDFKKTYQIPASAAST